MVLDEEYQVHKNIKLMMEFLNAQFLVLHYSYNTLMMMFDLHDVICNIAIYADDTTLYSKCGQPSDL